MSNLFDEYKKHKEGSENTEPSSTSSLYEQYKNRNNEEPKELSNEDLRSQYVSNEVKTSSKMDKYNSVMSNADFAEKSKYVSQNKNIFQQMFEPLVDTTYRGINKDNIGLTGKRVETNNDFLTDEEIALFNYYYNTGDYKNANDLYADLQEELLDRSNAYMNYSAKNRIDNYGNVIGESALSVPVNVLGGAAQAGAGLVGGAVSAVTGNGFSEGWNTIAKLNSLSNYSNAVREASTNKIAQDTGNEIAPFLYQTGMSVADSMLSALVAGGVGETASLVALGGSAAQQKTMEVLANGGTAQEAAASGIASGIIEGVTEKLPLDHLTKILKGEVKGGFRELAKVVARNMLSEGGEEVASEMANALADAIILDWANENGAESDYSKLYQEEIANGATEQEAALAMLGEYAKNIGVSFAGGALGAMFSGGIFGGVRLASDAKVGKTTNSYERTQDIADLARKEGREDIAQMIEKNPSNVNVGFAQEALAQDAVEAIRDKNATAEDKIRGLERLSELREKSAPKTGITDKDGKMLHIDHIRWENGEPVFWTKEGRYSASDVKITDSAAKLINLTEDIPESARQTFIENYNGENLGDYVNKFETAYELGKMDWQEDLTKMVTDDLLTEDQMKNIYAAAQKDETSETQKLENLKKNLEEKKKLIPDKKLRVKIDTSAIDLTKLNDNQRHNVTYGMALAKALGFNLTFFDSTKETGDKAHINGSYDASNNTISIDVNATNTGTHNKGYTNAITTTLSHEITHWAKTNAPGIYKAFQDAMLKALAENYGQETTTIGEYVYLNKARYPGHSDEEVADELVARACENMLQNSKFAKEALVRMTQEERKTLKDKIVEFFNKIRLAIKEIMGRTDSKSDEYELLTKDMERLGELQKMWDDLIREAASNSAWADTDISDAIKSGVLLNGSEANNFLLSEKTYDEGGRDFLDKWLKKQKDITASERTAILDSMEQVYDTVQKLKEGYQSYSNWAEAGAELRGDDGEISVVVNNGDYALNIDFATVCKKREVLNKVLNELVKSGDLNIYTLTGTDINRINQIIKENGFEIACALCFVDAKRYRVAEWARSFEDTFNDVIYQFAGANGKTADEFNYTGRSLDNPTEALISDADDVNLAILDKIIKDNTGDTGSLNAKGTIAKAIKENRRLWHKINAAEILSSAGLDEIRRKNKALYKLVNGWEGSAKPKLSHEKIPYVNDILKSGKFNPKAAFKVGGVRIQSFSDFVPTMIFDYVQMVSELQAKGLPAHAYTKELTFAKLFGLTGIKINLSAIAKGKPIKNEWYDSKGNIKKEYRDLYARANAYVGLKTNEEGFPVDADGNVITTNYNMTDDELLRAVYETDDESIDLEEAMKLQNTPGYDKNVGIIFVGASNNAIRKMLDDPNIPMVIPYHKSGINPVVAHLRNIASYTDYTDVQNTMFADGKKIDRSKLKNDAEKAYYDSLNWYTLLEKNKNNAKKAASEYIKLCEKKGWKPKFYEFKDNPNYYKLLEDFRMYDSIGIAAPQQVVKLTNGLDKNGKAIINMPSNEEFIKVLEGDEKTGGLKKYDKHISELENGKLKKITDQIRKELKEAQYSLKEDSEGKELTEDQVEFFKNSVVKDAEGRLIRVYHGTKNSGFTVFNKADDGISYFFTDNKEVAESYSGVSALQNPDTPMSFEELEGAFEFFDNEIEETKDGFLITDSDGEEHAVKTLKEAQAWLVDNNISIASAQGIGEATNYEVYLNIQNPLVIDAQGENWNTVNFEPEDTELAERMHPVYSRLLELWKKEKEGSLTKAEIKELEEVEEKYSELENESNRKFKVYETTRDVARYAYENGYDGVIFNNIVDNGGYSLSDASSTVYVVFNSNQIKSIYNEHPTGNPDIRYSMKEDSEGKELSQDQIDFFAKSQARDAEGRLKVLYHGTKEFGFTIFDTEKSDDKLSFFFTDSKDIAKSYANWGMLILPTSDHVVDVTKNTSLPDREAKNFKTVQEAQDYLDSVGIKVDTKIEKSYGREREYFSLINPSLGMRTTFGKTGFLEYASDIRRRGTTPRAIYKVYLNLINPLVVKADGNNWYDLAYSRMDATKNPIVWEGKNTREITKWASENGFDGVIFEDIVDAGSGAETRPELRKTANVYVALNSNQIKSVGNLHPTGDSDIRYSIKDTVVDVNGKVYHDVLDVSDKVTKTKANNPQKLKELILGLAEHHMTLLGMDDVPEEVYFARTSDKAPKGKKEPSKVLNELIYSNGDTRRATIVHIEDALKASVWYDEYYKNEHGWLDEKGWEKRKLFVLDNGTIYPVYLSIGKARDGRRILYSANLVAKEGVRTEKDSPKGKLIGNLTPSQRSVAPKADKVNKEKINTNTAAEKEDSLGRKLSEGQISYFNRSVVRNKIGQLLRMYHGTWENFTVFKTNEFSKELSGLSKIKGYFSEDKSFSESYGEVKEFYLNITNPLDMGDGEARTLHEWKLWFKNHGINGVLFDDALLDDSLIGATFEGKRYYVPFEIVDPLSPYRKGNGNVTEMIQKAGYDGIKWGYDEAAWMPFSEEQIKSVDNFNPTEDPDVMFSWKDNDGYLHLDADDVLSMDDFEDYLNRVIGKNKRIEAHLRRLNVEIKDNVILNNTKLYQFAKTIKENYAPNETIKSIAEELAKAYRKVTDIEAFDKAAESVAKKYATDEEAVKALYSDIREASWRISDNLTMAEKYNEAMKELRERLKNVKEEVREEAQRKRLIQKIVEREDKLITMLRKNDKENHIPDVLKAPLKTLLELVNVESYISTEAMANNFNALANALQNVSADYSDPASMDEALKDLTLYFDSNSYFVQNVKDIAAEVQESVNKAMNVRKGASVLDLSLESLKKLNEALVAISHAAWNYDRVLAEDTTQRISDRSESTMRFVGQFAVRKAMSDVLKRAISFFAWDNTTPIYGYDRFGEGGRETFRGIMKGDDQLTLNSKTIIDFTKSVFTGQEAEDWSKDFHNLGIGDYKITTAQIMSLYCLNKRQAAKQHLYAAKDLYGKHLEGAAKNVYGEVIDGQGIVIGATKGNEKTVPIKVTKADVERITSMLTERQRQVADALQEFMSTTCADWGNYVTMRRFGIMQFGEKDYFPMQVFRENSPSLPQEIPQQASIFKLLNMGFTKSLNERGNGALELNSIFDVFIKHSSEMAAYNAFALPILDTYKWLSYKEDGPDGIRSLKTVSRLAYGDDGMKFIMNHLEDLNGKSDTMTSLEQMVKSIIRRYKTAATAANMRVVLMQPTSYLRAVNEIDIKYLKRAINLNPKALKEIINEMNEKCPLAMKKDGLGAFDVNISRTVAEQALQTENVKSAKGMLEKAMNISMIAASKADEITWGTLYKAVQLETKEKHPEATGETFDSIVNDRFRDICYRTQVFDSINARSNLMRKKDIGHQILTAFGSEPTLSYSMLSNNVFMFAVDARNGVQRAWNKWGKKIKHAFVAYMMSAIAVSAVAAAPDWLRDDEDDKNFIETYFKNFGMNILGEVTGLLPYFRDIYSGFVEGYDPSRPDEEIIKTAKQAKDAMVKAIESGEITYRTVYQAAKLFSQSTGLPVGNLVRDFKSLWNKTVGEVFGMKIK